MRTWVCFCGLLLAAFAIAAAACSGGDPPEPTPLPTLVIHPSPSPEPGCRAFLESQVAIPNANTPIEGARYERTIVPDPTRQALLVTFGDPDLPTSSWVLLDSGGVIASDVQPDKAEVLGRLERCAREVSAESGAEREYAVLSTPAPSDYSISVGGTEIAIPSGASVGRLSSDLPADFRTISRGASYIDVDSSGLGGAYVTEEDEEEFRPLFEALVALDKAAFPELVSRLDELPYPPVPLPIDLPVTSFFVGGEVVPVPPETSITSYMSSCKAEAGCYSDPLIVILGESAVVFELTGPKLLVTLHAPPEEGLEPLMAALERATAGS